MNKLVRDKIPGILQRNAKKCVMHVADNAEFNVRITDKLREEVSEFVHDPCIESLQIFWKLFTL